MDTERYFKLQNSEDLQLTQEEIQQGWFFCICEWDGMLMNKTWPEAKFCGCIKEQKNNE